LKLEKFRSQLKKWGGRQSPIPKEKDSQLSGQEEVRMELEGLLSKRIATAQAVATSINMSFREVPEGEELKASNPVLVGPQDPLNCHVPISDLPNMHSDETPTLYEL